MKTVRLFLTIIVGWILASLLMAQTVRYKGYRLRSTDVKPAGAITASTKFFNRLKLPVPDAKDCLMVAEMSYYHGAKRPIWRMRYNNKTELKVDAASGKVLSFYDVGREEAQFKGTQRKQKPLIQSRDQARRVLDDIAKKLGLTPELTVDSFAYTPNPAEPRFSAGRSGITLKNARGKRVAGLSIDHLDGGLNKYWIAP